MLSIQQSRRERSIKKAASVASPWATDTWKPFATPDRRILFLSIALQLPLALLLGHSYDMRVFMATGYLVGTGHDPYVAQNLSAVFPHISFQAMTAIGYPPPWPLVLGLLYRVSYALVANELVYNLAIKMPIIAATIGLAYLVAALLQNLGAKPAVARAAWVFLLLNPALLYFGAAWGQIDVIVALLSAVGARPSLRATMGKLSRGAGLGRLLQAHGPAHRARGRGLPAAHVLAARSPLRCRVSRRRRFCSTWLRSSCSGGVALRSCCTGTARSP